jgi:3-methyladenine DNA glycosylase AlkD
LSTARASDVVEALALVADAKRAFGTAQFFKTGPGEYGEGDVFIGVTMPLQRKVVREHRDLPLAEAKKLLRSEIHEHRMTALLILVDQYKRGDDAKRQAIYDLYLASTSRINNWDLVDASAEHIVGAHTYDDGIAPLLVLAESADLWERRIAMVSCFEDIKRGDPDRPLAVAEVLAYDDHDLIQKAVGWMLREVGKRIDRRLLVEWLADDDRRYRRLPRTELRYAIEHFRPEERQRYLKGTA